MKFKVVEFNSVLKNKKVFDVSLNKDCINSIMGNFKSGDLLLIDENSICLNVKLYGNSKKESILIQKDNCKRIIKLYKVCKKIIKKLRHKKIEFEGTFYVNNLKNKKNNNDFMLSAMLDTYFNFNAFKRLGKATEYASDYIDKENSLNNMCDFKDNLCVSHRELGKKGCTGCCPSFCKYTKQGVCTVRNLSCKIFMCDYLEKKGYYFTPNTIPILKLHLSFFERFNCFGLLFKPEKKVISRLWLARILSVSLVIVFVLLILTFLIWYNIEVYFEIFSICDIF